jgi:flagellar export protein FliJ
MARFQWRLEKLLEYRRLQERWAKDAYLDCRLRVLEGEAALQSLASRKEAYLRKSANSLLDRLLLEQYLLRLESEEREQSVINDLLLQEADVAKAEWVERRKAVKAMEKLRSAALTAWEAAERRTEQSELDEWAILRRVA